MKEHSLNARGLSLTGRLMLTILPILLGVMILFGQQSNRLYADTITNELVEQLELQLDSVASQLSGSLSEINRMGFYVYAHQELRDELARALFHPDDFTAADRISLQSDLIEPMMRMIDSPGNYSYILYPVSGRVFCDYSNVRPLSTFPEALPLEEMMSGGYAHTFYHMASFKQEKRVLPHLCITRVIYYSDRTPLAVLLTTVRADRLEKAIQSILPEEDAYYYRCALENGDVVFEGGVREDDMIFMNESTFGGKARLEYGVRPSLIEEQLAAQNRELVRFAVLMLSAAMLLIAVLSNLVMRRMQLVLRKFSRLTPGQELTEAPISGRDEAALLDQTFTRLYRDYRAGVISQQKLRESQRLLENNLLLSRINPHFLYNTLSAIRWNMPVENWGTIDELVAFYRGILSKGKEIALLSGELELMGQYLSLQRFTYSRKIDYTQELAEGTASLFIPKFILQPVFENALKYGGGEETIHLTFRARLDGDLLIFSLQNDGAPIDEETKRRLNNLNLLAEDPLYNMNFDKDDAFGYGVFNVIMRLRLLFGFGYGLWLERPPEGGTLARFILPACSQPETVMNWKKRD